MVKSPNLTYQDEIDVSSSHFLADLINPIGVVLLLRKPDNEGATLKLTGYGKIIPLLQGNPSLTFPRSTAIRPLATKRP